MTGGRSGALEVEGTLASRTQPPDGWQMRTLRCEPRTLPERQTNNRYVGLACSLNKIIKNKNRTSGVYGRVCVHGQNNKNTDVPITQQPS